MLFATMPNWDEVTDVGKQGRLRRTAQSLLRSLVPWESLQPRSLRGSSVW